MTDGGEKPVLLISSGPNLAPLYPGLAETYDLVFFQQAGAQTAQAAGVGAAWLEQAAGPDARERADTNAALLTTRTVQTMPAIVERMAATLPPDHPLELNSGMPDWFPGYVMRMYGWQALYLECLESIAGARTIAGLITHEDVGPDTRTVVNWANARDIPTLHLPHAACHLLAGENDIHHTTRAKWVLASGAYMAGFYAGAGVPDDRIAVVGVPVWDALIRSQLPGRDEARGVLGIPAGRVMMYGTTWGQTTSLRSRFEKEFHETEDAVIEMARAAGAYLVINMHPNENRDNIKYYTERLEKAELDGLVTADHGLYCARAADVIVKHGPSNFCVEAAIMGVPTCYVQTEGFDFAHPLPPRGPAGRLPVLVDDALTVPAESWQDFIGMYNAAYPDGGATERALEVVKMLCR